MKDDIAVADASDICAIEIAPMRDVSEPPSLITIRPARRDETPDLWCVIARLKSGAGRVLRDERERSAAIRFAEALRDRLRAASTTLLPIVDI